MIILYNLILFSYSYSETWYHDGFYKETLVWEAHFNPFDILIG